MKLSDEEVKAIKDRADRIWSHNEIIGNNHTTCSSCLQVKLCMSDIATGQSTCKECYVEKSIAEAERKKQLANLMPDVIKQKVEQLLASDEAKAMQVTFENKFCREALEAITPDKKGDEGQCKNS